MEFIAQDLTEGYKKPNLSADDESLTLTATDLIARTFLFTAPYPYGGNNENRTEASPRVQTITDIAQHHD